MKKTIVVFAHSRKELLKDSILSILSAHGNQDWLKVLVCQTGHTDVAGVVTEFEDEFDLVLRLKPQHKTALANINQNRIIGTTICFDLLGSDIVLGIEEDTMIAYDALEFIDQVFLRYQSKIGFRGINLGSHEPRTAENINTYSLLRFGLHGQAGVITRKTWRNLSLKKIRKNIAVEGYDSWMEYYLKSGFMVTPNASRLLDRGWVGTHMPSDAIHPYFEKQNHSWVGTTAFDIRDFVRKDVEHSWRKDAVVFKMRHSVFYLLRRSQIIYQIYFYSRKIKIKWGRNK